MIDPIEGHNLLADATRIYVRSDPFAACKTIAGALQKQAKGGRETFLRILAEEMGIAVVAS